MIPYVKVTKQEHDYFLEVPKVVDCGMAALEAGIQTVEYITANYPAPYTLCVSGGIDSQAMLYTWIKSGKKFNTFSAIYNDDLNYHDLENLIQFSVKYDCPINFSSFNVVDFLLNEHKDYALNYRCGSPHMCVFMKFVELIDSGTVIFSGQYKRPGFNLFVDKNNFSIYRYAEQTGRSVVPWFFLETKEIYSSFKYLEKAEGDNHFAYQQKCLTYQLNGFPVLPQDEKYTGFEQIKDHFDKNYSHLVTTRDKFFNTPSQRSKRTFDLLFRNKYEARFLQDKYVISTKDL